MFGWSQTTIVMLFYFLCCFVIVTSAFPEGHIDSENVTFEQGAGGRIAGGDDPDRGARAAPYQAQITREGATFCSGTIVSERHIVTAAHCVEGASPQELTVRIGSNIRGQGLVVPIEEIVLHPDYDYPQNNFDIAYMRTGESISISRTTRSAFIASPGASVPRELHVTGWGYQEDNQKKLADKIRAVDLPVISNTECQVFYPMMSITKNMICLYSLKEQDKGTCVGDGGDPATVSQRLVGVSSTTRGCGPGMAPSVFTYVDAEEIRSFILNGISGKTSQRPQRPSECPEEHPDERPEKATKTPESDSKKPEECPEKVAKTPKDDSDYYEEHPGEPSKRPEEHPDERPEKATKTPESDSKKPEECPEKVAKTPKDDSDYYEEHPVEPSKRPEKHPNERPEKTPAGDSDYYEAHPKVAPKRPEKHPNECPEKVAKTPSEGSDYDEERPGDLLSKRPEEYSADRPEDLSKGPQRQPADRPQKRPAEREP